MKPEIIWLIDSLGHGGAEMMTLAILKHMHSDRYNFRVCTLQIKQGNPVANELDRIGIPVDLIHIPNLRRPSNLPKLIRYLLGHQPALIHTQLEFANILGSLSGRLLRIPVVNTLHTHESPQHGSAYWRNRLSTFCLNHFSDRIIAVSQNTQQFHIRNNGIREEKLVTIYNGIDLEIFRPRNPRSRKALRESLGMPADAIVFITVAVLREPKGIQHMLEAIPSIVEKVPDFFYLIVGDGDYGQTLRNITASLNIQRHVVFAGPQKNISPFLAISDVFALPSLTEALPTALIEAMASHKPIIASRVGGVPEMVTDNVNGIRVNPGAPSELAEACIRLANDEHAREKMGAKGFRLAREKFDIHLQVQALLNLYANLINRHGK